MTEYVYKLENFDTPLENSKMIFLLGQAAAATTLPCIFDDLVNSPKLVSRILIASQRSELPLLFKAPWSAVFSPVDGRCWQLVLTYCLYMTRPAIIVIEDGVQVPEGFMSKFQSSASASGLQIVTCRLLQGLQGAGNQLASADTIFLPLVEDLTGADADACLAVLKGQLGSSGAPFEQKREWLREVRSAKAALVWTRIRERGAGGAVYWFDPADGAEGAKHLGGKSIRKLLGALGELL
jgi:hypothetical protein